LQTLVNVGRSLWTVALKRTYVILAIFAASRSLLLCNLSCLKLSSFSMFGRVVAFRVLYLYTLLSLFLTLSMFHCHRHAFVLYLVTSIHCLYIVSTEYKRQFDNVLYYNVTYDFSG